MNLLLIGVVLFGATVHQSTAHNYEKLLAKFNYERREYAKANNIPNMYKLEWNQELAEIGQGFLNFAPNFRFIKVGRNRDAMRFDNWVESLEWAHSKKYVVDDIEEIQNTLNSRELDLKEAFEKFASSRRGIGCRYWPRSFNGEIFKRNYSSICFIGPKYTNTSQIRGPAGSACGDDDVEDGLCVSKLHGEFKLFELPYPPSPPQTNLQPGPTVDYSATHGYVELLAKLNYERREFAKAMNISNMYKLKWSESLAETAKNMPKEWRGLQPNYRYFFVGRNKDAMDLENKLFNWTDSQLINNWSALKKWTDKNENYSVFLFEPLLPLQTRIGCASVHKEMSYRGYRGQLYAEYSSQCLIGPERSFKNSIRKIGPPGSDCGDDDVEDGLCASKRDGDIAAFRFPPPSSPGKTVREEITPTDDDLGENDSDAERTPRPPLDNADLEVNWKKV